MLGLVLTLGCEGESRVMVDGGALPDSSVGDADTSDAGVSDAGPECETNLASFEPALGGAIRPVLNLCRPPAQAMDVIEAEGGTLRVYELVATSVGTTTTFTLSRFTLMADGSASNTEMVAMTTHESTEAVMTYVGGYLDISPGEHGAIFGYTTTAPGFVGGVFDLDLGEGTIGEVPAPGNYDAAWLDDSSWVLDGMGLGIEMGPGLYLYDSEAGTSRVAAREMGEYSGSVALLSDVIVAGAFASTGLVFVFDRERLVNAATPLDAREDALARLDAPSVFELVFGNRLATIVYDGPTIAAIEARVLAEEGDEWTLGAAEPITSGAVFTNIVAAGANRAFLQHGNGVLLVELR